jgi:hypothetical protein
LIFRVEAMQRELRRGITWSSARRLETRQAAETSREVNGFKVHSLRVVKTNSGSGAAGHRQLSFLKSRSADAARRAAMS